MTDAVGWHSQIAQAFDAKYTSSPAFIERFSVWIKLIDGHVSPDSDVLDAGCGSGIFSDYAAQRARSVFAFDGSPEMIEISKARAAQNTRTNIEIRTAQLGETGLLDGRSFDLILCSSVLEYVEDYWRAFDGLAEALKPNGTILFSMPNGASYYRKAEKLAYSIFGRPAYYAHVRNVPTLAEVQTGLNARGFVIKSQQFYAASPIVSSIARALGRADLGDNLFVLACARTTAGPSK